MDLVNEDSKITNARLQEDEILALSAIFTEDWTFVGDNVYSIKIANISGNEVYFQTALPENYPLSSPPTYQISAPWMSRSEKNKLCIEIDDVYSQNIGESIIFLWINKIRNFLEENSFIQQEDCETDESSVTDENIQDISYVLKNIPVAKELDELPALEHGEPITDRKSVFQAHFAKVVSVLQVKQVLEKLNGYRKIATATHNIYAYRIACQGSFIQDCEDDGETKAGSNLLHLLQVLDVSDVLVIVSRWYGGIHLGTDRFKHINNAARILLHQLGYVKKKESKGSSKNRKKK